MDRWYGSLAIFILASRFQSLLKFSILQGKLDLSQSPGPLGRRRPNLRSPKKPGQLTCRHRGWVLEIEQLLRLQLPSQTPEWRSWRQGNAQKTFLGWVRAKFAENEDHANATKKPHKKDPNCDFQARDRLLRRECRQLGSSDVDFRDGGSQMGAPGACPRLSLIAYNCRHFAATMPLGHKCAQLQMIVHELQRVALNPIWEPPFGPFQNY